MELLSLRNKILPAKTLVIFTGLFDLGNKSVEIHERLGKLISKSADEVIITHPIFAKELKSGGDNIFEMNTPEEVIGHIESFIKSSSGKKGINSRILVMNHIPAKIYKYIQEIK